MPPAILVLEDDPLWLNTVRRQLSPRYPVVPARSLREARDVLRTSQPLLAAIVDVILPDGSGFDAIEELRQTRGNIPVLVASGRVDHDTISRAQAAGAQYAAKPFTRANVSAFMAWANSWSVPACTSLERLVRELSEEHRLSRREADVVHHAALGIAPGEIHEHLGVSANTVKTITRRVLRKSRAESLAVLVAPLTQAVMGGDA